MTFFESVNTCLKEKYVDFNGRASRSEYWWFTLFYIIVLVVISSMLGLIFGEDFLASPVSIVIFLVVIAGFFLPTLAVSIRRLHDIDKSGWWYLIGLVPYIGGLIFFVFMLLPPKEPNRFGEAPSN